MSEIATAARPSYLPGTADFEMERGSIGPVAPADRLALVDVLRGVAILGVLVAYTMWNLGTPPADTWSSAERFVDTTLGILVDAKFVTMFAFLFGAGTAQQWRRIEARGENPIAIHVRRMLFLLVVVLTGRNAKDELIEIADLVTEMTLVKHPFRSGIKAQAGVEF